MKTLPVIPVYLTSAQLSALREHCSVRSDALFIKRETFAYVGETGRAQGCNEAIAFWDGIDEAVRTGQMRLMAKANRAYDARRAV